jgi:hypothetical protein
MNSDFGDNVVFRYTDQQAVDDGVLVAVAPKDRVSRAAWEYLASNSPDQDREVRDKHATAFVLGLIANRGKDARRVYEQNTDGGIYQVWIHIDGAGIYAFANQGQGKRMWLMPNEQGGLTLMFPEDY